MRKTFLTVFTVILFSNVSATKAQESNFYPKNTVVEGKGINGVNVGRTNRREIVKKFGKGYKLITHSNYSNQIKYSKLGLSFFYCKSNKKQTIFSIEIRKPFKAVTRKGIVLGKSTVKDVIERYGDSEDISEASWLTYAGVDFRNVNVETDEINSLDYGDTLINEINIYPFDFTPCDEAAE